MEKLESSESQKNYLTNDELENIKKLDFECVWSLMIFKNWTHKFIKIRDWGEWEVSFDKSKLENKIWLKDQYLYHNHPIKNYKEESDLDKNIIITAPPSSDDFILVNNSEKNIKHRIISPSWIWEISINNSIKSNKTESILWSIFSDLMDKDISEIDLKLKKLKLESENPIYFKISEAYSILMNWSTDKKIISDNIKIFKENMFKMWFDVDFKFYE